MVGFGSSLRMARRTGWEGAYLDYETLKLLLSQIEAVYEEEGHRVRSRQLRQQEHEENTSSKSKRKRSDVQPRDYRDELFLEPNSDAAYVSIDDDDDDDDEEETDEEQEYRKHLTRVHSPSSNYQHVEFNHFTQQQPFQNFPHQAQPPKRFTLSHSTETVPYEDDEDGNENPCARSSCCVPVWAWPESEADQKAAKNRRKKHHAHDALLTDEEDNSFYVGNRQNDSNAFFLAGNDDDNMHQLPVDSAYGFSHYSSFANAQQGPSLLNAPTVLGGFPNESTGLVTPTGASPSMFTFSASRSKSKRPPLSQSRNGDALNENGITEFPHVRSKSGDQAHYTETSSSFPEQQLYCGMNSFSNDGNMIPSSITKDAKLKSERERNRQRQARRVRKKRQRYFREKRERRVPRHIRVAHAKARAITERFLGLLRAETEKVMLFAQSRLGELADTAGSLRFLDDIESNAFTASHHKNQRNNIRSGQSYEYPLADGGMHPSASSSSDEGGTSGIRHRIFSWSDDYSSDEDLNSNEQASRLLASQRGPSPAGLGPTSFSDDMTEPSARSDIGSNRLDSKDSSNKFRDSDTIHAVRRQIAHFAELRKSRSVFQRNDQILGEDMLFLSAVEEADGYTAVGVELMHVLKYINVNLIAVRKICRKHDRLLMNRMLGGYYQRARKRGSSDSNDWHIEDVKTLGGLVARVSGEVYDAHPALIGQMDHFKLIGVYDTKIQKLANSRTVEVVSSCLALALSEYEVARSRAAALTRLNSRPSGNSVDNNNTPHFEFDNMGIVSTSLASDEQGTEGAPSTASSISLTRLRFTVTSIFALREAARYKSDYFFQYLARVVLAFTGQQVYGEGLDGCSRETLDFIVSYNPDSVLLLDVSVLFEGLKSGQWNRVPMDELMIATLATANTPIHVPNNVALQFLAREERVVANAVSVVPESKSVMLKRLIRGQFPRRLSDRRVLAAEEMPKIALRLNRMSCLLYMMNYFISHSTTLAFVEAEGIPHGYSAMVIGIPNLSAIFITIFHCWLAKREQKFLPYRYSVGTFRHMFIFSSLIAAAGNVLHAVAMNKNSILLAVLGRFLFGFSSAEILHRHLIAACMPSHFITESARLMLFRASGIAFGLFVGSAAEAIPISVQKFGVRSLQTSNWLMFLFWVIHLIRVMIQFRSRAPQDVKQELNLNREEVGREITAQSDCSEFDSSSSEGIIETPASLHRKTADFNQGDKAPGMTSKKEKVSITVDADLVESSRLLHNLPRKTNGRKKRVVSQARYFARLRKFLSFHIGIPILLLLLMYVTYAIETFFTASPLITARYFGWSGARTGTFLGWLAAMILPIHFVCEIVARRYAERNVIKRSLFIIGISLFAMINWTSIYALAPRVDALLSDVSGKPRHLYDWSVGVIQYVFGLIFVFTGLVSLEGAALSLLSKISPAFSRSVALNVGTFATVLGFVARFLADMNVLVLDLSHKLINVDLVNSLLMPLLIFSLVLTFFVRKHFFFLM